MLFFPHTKSSKFRMHLIFAAHLMSGWTDLMISGSSGQQDIQAFSSLDRHWVPGSCCPRLLDGQHNPTHTVTSPDLTGVNRGLALLLPPYR